MNFYQFKCRVNHFFTAKHYRGHGIHSPFLYDFIRTVLIADSKKDLVVRIEERYWPNRVQYVNCLEQIDFFAYVVILPRPFRSLSDQQKWDQWRAKHHCVSVHLKGHMVIFFDKRLQDQHFKIRS